MSIVSIVRRQWPACVLTCVSLLGCQGSADEDGPRAFDHSNVNLHRLNAVSAPHGEGTHFETMAPKALLSFLFGDVSAASGLPILSRVPMSVQTQQEQLEQLTVMAAEESQIEGLQQLSYGSEVALLALGLDRFLADEIQGDEVPPDRDDTELPPPEEYVVAGYYDTNKKQFFLSDSVTSEYRAHVMRHELMHALQDQHFDLDQRLLRLLPDLDAVLAFKAVVEGQSEFAALRAKSLRPPSLSLLPNMKTSVQPRRVLASLMSPRAWPLSCHRPVTSQTSDDISLAPDMSMFPYYQGLLFFAELVQDGKVDGHDFPYWVQETFRATPGRTADILHPQKWAENRFSPPPAPLSLQAFEHIDKHPVLWQSGLGELVMQAYLYAEDRTYSLAEALRRDRVVVLEQPSSTLPAVAWVTEWTDMFAARRFAQAAVAAQAKLAKRQQKLGIAHSDAIVQQNYRHVGLLLEVARDLDHPAASAEYEALLVEALQQAMVDATSSAAP